MAPGKSKNLVPNSLKMHQTRATLPRKSKERHLFFPSPAGGTNTTKETEEPPAGRHPTGQHQKTNHRSLDELNAADGAGTSELSPTTGVTPSQPAKASGQPAKASGQPAKASGQPAKASGQPAKAPGQPAKSPGQPVKATAVPADTAGGSEGSGDGGHPPAVIETIENCVAVAAAYDEEERDEPLVNDELVAKAGTQKAIADTYRKENERRAAELKDCLVLITHLAKKASEVDAGALTWEVYTKKSCDEFLYNREMLNLSPDSDDMLKSLIRHSGHTPDSPEGLKVAAIATSQGKLRHACVRFNDRIVPFSTDGFVLCAALWDSEWDGSLPIALFPEQLLVLLAVVRSKSRNPCCKAQFTRSGDPGALARQARVVQRWINATEVKRDGECIGIGKLCTVGWTDISEEELAGDELGDLSPDDLVPTSAHRRVYYPNEVQVELF
ncbi:unnamed protein product [Closterium sp. Yama58-4]|nr:unnamed protein product [Closterium sp. Yama58-4]